MRIGILVIGSLLWDESEGRQLWRERLCLDKAQKVPAPIYYGRRSQSRGDTYTMTFSDGAAPGTAVLVPCREDVKSCAGLIKEAQELWKAESSKAKPNSIGATWGCVGALFCKDLNYDLASRWTKWFQINASPVGIVGVSGELLIDWPQLAIGFEVILATATKPEETKPTAQEMADAWINQSEGHERYFFQNVRHGIRTPDDAAIWRRIEHGAPKWLKNEDYREARKELCSEAS